jgi:hypothetical protein
MFDRKYLPLFCDTDDNRINLFFHYLQRIRDDRKSAKFFFDIPVFEKEPRKYMQNEYFDDFVADSANKKNIHKEWVMFFADLFLHANKQISDNNKNCKILFEELRRNENSNNDERIIYEIAKLLYSVSGSSISIQQDFFKNLFDTSVSNVTLGSTIIPGVDIIGEINNQMTLSSPINNFQKLFKVLHDVLNNKLYNKTNNKRFTYQYKKYLASLDFDESTTSKSDDDFWFKPTDKISAKEYIRKNDGKLYRSDDKNKEGKEIHLDYVDKYTCKATGFYGDGSNPDNIDTCAEFIESCLAGKNNEQCKQILENKTYNWNVGNEIKLMSPQYINNFIKVLKIPKHRVYVSELHIHINSLGDFNEWINQINKDNEFTPDQVKKIKENDPLKKFINELAKYVNSEPAIINSNYIENESDKHAILSSRLSSTTLARFGLGINLPHNYKGAYSQIAPLSQFNRLENLFLDMQSRVRMLIGPRGAEGVMTGGGQITKQIGGNPFIDDKEFRYTHQVLKKYFEYYEDILTKSNKALQPDDRAKLVSFLDKLQESEKNLKRGFKVISEYSNLVLNMGDNVKETLNLRELEQLTRERDEKTNRVFGKQMVGLGLLRSLAEQAIEGNEI